MTPGLQKLQRLQYLRNERTAAEATEALIQLRFDFMHTIMLNRAKTTEFLTQIKQIQFKTPELCSENLSQQRKMLQQNIERMISDINNFSSARKNPILPKDDEPDEYSPRFTDSATSTTDEPLADAIAEGKQSDDVIYVSEEEISSLYLRYAERLKGAYNRLFPGKGGASDQVLKLVLVAIAVPEVVRAQYYTDLSNKVSRITKIPEIYHWQRNVTRNDLIEVRRMMEAIFPRDTLVAANYVTSKDRKINVMIPNSSNNDIRNFYSGVILVKDSASTPFKPSKTRRDIKVVSTSFERNAQYEADAYQVRDFFNHYNRTKKDAEYRTQTGIGRSDSPQNLDETLEERLRPVTDLIKRRRADASRLERLAVDLLIQGEDAPTKSADVLNRRRRMVNRFERLLAEPQEKK